MKFLPFKSAFATLSVLLIQASAAFGAVVIDTQPANVTVPDATKITLTVAAHSTTSSPLSYKWWKLVNNQAVEVRAESSVSSFVIASSKNTDEGEYYVTVTEQALGFDWVNSANGLVTVNVRPKISGNPAAPAVPPTAFDDTKDDVSFTVTLDPVVGEGPFIYSWQKKIGTTYTLVAGPTNTVDRSNVLQLNNVELDDAGIYRAVVTNASNINVFSKDVILKVNTRPTILTQPAANLIVTYGAAGTLKVVAGGNGPFYYRWFKNNVLIPKASAATLSIKGTDIVTDGLAEGPGTYRVEVVNSYSPGFTDTKNPFFGSTVTSSMNADVVVIRKPKITTQPVKLTKSLMTAANAATFNVQMDTTGNEGTLLFQWYKDNKILNVPGSTTDTLTFDPLTWNDRGSYKVVIKNQVGTVTSASALLTVISPPIITSRSPDQTFGGTKGAAKLFVVATGTAPLKYEWRFRPVAQGVYNPLVIGTAATLALSNLSVARHGYYQCTVLNAPKGEPTGTVVSAEMYLQVDEAPKITKQTTVMPYDGSITKGTPNIPAGKKLHLVVEATGTDRTAPAGDFLANPLTFQWLKNGIAIGGATTSQLVIDPASTLDSGKYSCRVGNYIATLISATVVITVNGPPVITVQPGDVTGTEEDLVQSTPVVATGKGSIQYEWQKQTGGVWGAATNPTKQLGAKLVFAQAKVAYGGKYRVRVYSFPFFGDTFSNEINVQIDPIDPPTIQAVAGISNVPFFPRIARAGEKVRIFGTNLNYPATVTFGGVVGSSVYEPVTKSLLATVPANAPTTASNLQVTITGRVTGSSGGGTATAPQQFTRSVQYANDLANATILTPSATATTVLGDNRDVNDYVFYVLKVKDPSFVTINLDGFAVGGSPVDLSLDVYTERVTGNTAYVGPDNLTLYTFAGSSPYIGITSEVVSVTTNRTDTDILILVRPGLFLINGMVGYGPYSLTVSASPTGVAPLPPPPAPGAPPPPPSPETGLVEVAAEEWHASDAFAKSASSDPDTEGLPTVRLGGEGSSSEPVQLWADQVETLSGAGEVAASFRMGLDGGSEDGDDQFGWQITGTDGKPLGALWVNGATGQLSLVQPDGSVQESIQRITPGGGAHRMELVLSAKGGTWQARIDGVDVAAPAALPAGVSFGGIYAAWDLGPDTKASGASMIFSDFTVEDLAAE
ncbi:immunoglobulin domain-containing protein [Brevifollis gellanilyticus]|uniref:Ig-like domain-containing protein n=1 Tax=Brevifollis gellanilyticus TaxID=748831 RepID=A0A512MD05_9BACT|nr:immunoglobulin domain-containing protein [Brevifollis gellanilyticus]GEP44251.1 hypothetical protein BGE01nite_35420 [Brevifollis gellanilyticus]